MRPELVSGEASASGGGTGSMNLSLHSGLNVLKEGHMTRLTFEDSVRSDKLGSNLGVSLCREKSVKQTSTPG